MHRKIVLTCLISLSLLSMEDDKSLDFDSFLAYYNWQDRVDLLIPSQREKLARYIADGLRSDKGTAVTNVNFASRLAQALQKAERITVDDDNAVAVKNHVRFCKITKITMLKMVSSGNATCAMFNREGNRVLSAEGNKAYLINAQSGVGLAVFDEGQYGFFGKYNIKSATFNEQSDQILVSASNDGLRLVHLWDLKSGSKVFEIKCGDHHGKAAFDFQGNLIATPFYHASNFGSDSQGIGVWDIRSQKQVHVFELEVAEGGRYITGSPFFNIQSTKLMVPTNEQMIEWDMRLEKKRTVIKEATASAVLNTQGDSIACKWNKKAYLLTNIESDETVTMLTLPLGDQRHKQEEINSVAFNTEGSQIVIARDKYISLFDSKSGKYLGSAQNPSNAVIKSAVFNRRDNQLVTAGQNGVAIWDVSQD